jgi:ribosomal protein L29
MITKQVLRSQKSLLLSNARTNRLNVIYILQPKVRVVAISQELSNTAMMRAFRTLIADVETAKGSKA